MSYYLKNRHYYVIEMRNPALKAQMLVTSLWYATTKNLFPYSCNSNFDKYPVSTLITEERLDIRYINGELFSTDFFIKEFKHKHKALEYYGKTR